VASRLHSPAAWIRVIATNIRRLTVLLLGTTVMGAGFAMLVLPGPGILVVVIGLAILAREFAWAERTLDKTKARATDATLKLTSNPLGRLMFGLTAASLVVGGGVAAYLYSDYAVAGLFSVFAGLCAFAVLVPRIRRWIESAGATNGR
jgi:uncharacterized protein (TIGR02611 family)